VDSAIPDVTAKTLAMFSDGQKRDVRDSSVIDAEQAKWLYEEGFLKGIDASNLDGPAFLNMSITSKGMEFLQQKQKEVMDRPNSKQRDHL
jgi:hypothetical protein